MKVLVCGGRTYQDYDKVKHELDQLHEVYTITKIISGHARGADSLGERWAKENEVPLEIYPAEWDKYGKSAGHQRNYKMLIEGLPDTVIAFPGGPGTKNMLKQARTLNTTVETIIEVS